MRGQHETVKHPKLKTKTHEKKTLADFSKRNEIDMFLFFIYFFRSSQKMEYFSLVATKLNRKCGAIEFMNMIVRTNISRAAHACLFMNTCVWVTGDSFHAHVFEIWVGMKCLWWQWWWWRWKLFCLCCGHFSIIDRSALNSKWLNIYEQKTIYPIAIWSLCRQYTHSIRCILYCDISFIYVMNAHCTCRVHTAALSLL